MTVHQTCTTMNMYHYAGLGWRKGVERCVIYVDIDEIPCIAFFFIWSSNFSIYLFFILTRIIKFSFSVHRSRNISKHLSRLTWRKYNIQQPIDLKIEFEFFNLEFQINISSNSDNKIIKQSNFVCPSIPRDKIFYSKAGTFCQQSFSFSFPFLSSLFFLLFLFFVFYFVFSLFKQI